MLRVKIKPTTACNGSHENPTEKKINRVYLIPELREIDEVLVCKMPLESLM